MNIYDLIKKITKKPDDRPFIMGIDGTSGSGKTTVCDQISSVLSRMGYRVKQIRFDDFWSASDDSKAMRFNPERQLIGSDYRWQKLRDEILIPLREGNPVHCVVNDESVVNDRFCAVKVVTYDASIADYDVILVEGVFVVRDELRKYYDYSVYKRTPQKTSFERALKREGEYMVRWHEQYWRHEEALYVEKQQPHTKVDWLIDELNTTDLPKRNGFIARLLKGVQ